MDHELRSRLYDTLAFYAHMVETTAGSVVWYRKWSDLKAALDGGDLYVATLLAVV
jgi:hypothetical protein